MKIRDQIRGWKETSGLLKWLKTFAWRLLSLFALSSGLLLMAISKQERYFGTYFFLVLLLIRLCIVVFKLFRPGSLEKKFTELDARIDVFISMLSSAAT
jgi:hypothetical protein